MTDVRELRCTACHAPLELASARGGVITCKYCRTPLQVPGYGGAILSQVDFANPALPGWTTPFPQNMQIMPGPTPEMVARFEGGNTYRYVLNSSSTFDDFDATLTFRLLWGDVESTVTGLFFRRVGAGFYRAFVSTVGTFGLLYVVPAADQPDKRLVPYTAFSAIRKEPGAVNELRVICVRDRIRVLINGQQAASLRDSSAGHGIITIGAHSKVPMAAAYQSLVVREPEREAAAAPPPTPAHSFGLGSEGGWQVLMRSPAPSNVKIQSIKVVREATGLGLKEAKDIVELPQGAMLFSDTTRERAERLGAALRALGVDVHVRKA